MRNIPLIIIIIMMMMMMMIIIIFTTIQRETISLFLWSYGDTVGLSLVFYLFVMYRCESI